MDFCRQKHESGCAKVTGYNAVSSDATARVRAFKLELKRSWSYRLDFLGSEWKCHYWPFLEFGPVWTICFWVDPKRTWEVIPGSWFIHLDFLKLHVYKMYRSELFNKMSHVPLISFGLMPRRYFCKEFVAWDMGWCISMCFPILSEEQPQTAWLAQTKNRHLG